MSTDQLWVTLSWWRTKLRLTSVSSRYSVRPNTTWPWDRSVTRSADNTSLHKHPIKSDSEMLDTLRHRKAIHQVSLKCSSLEFKKCHLAWVHYLRCQILRSSTEGFHGSIWCDALLTKAKISDFDVAIFVQHQIFQLRQKNNRFDHRYCGKVLDYTHNSNEECLLCHFSQYQYTGSHNWLWPLHFVFKDFLFCQTWFRKPNKY